MSVKRKITVVYKCSDGYEFNTQGEADRHQLVVNTAEIIIEKADIILDVDKLVTILEAGIQTGIIELINRGTHGRD